MTALLAELQAKCSPELLASRDHDAIAAAVNAGRTRRKHPVMLSERGVRALLPATQASPLLRLLRDSSADVGIPAWFGPTLSALGVPVAAHEDYSDTLKSAWHWLLDANGIDVSSDATIAMLNIIGGFDPAKYGAAVATIKGLSTEPDPITEYNVRCALYAADGAWLGG